jgi:dihydroflavonol-4-reductase
MPESGPVLVTGATGFVGGAVLERLIAEGRRVRALTRSDSGTVRLHNLGAEAVIGDILRPETLRDAVSGCAVVYHLAGLNAFCLPDPSELHRMNVVGTGNVIRAAATAGVRRVVYTSSAATIGEPHGAIGREDTPHRGTFLSNYERSKWEAERAAFAAARDGGVDLVSVNPSSVQGPGRTRGTAKLLLGYLNGTLKALIDSRMSVVDIADCAEGHLLAERAGVPGERYVLSGATLTVREAIAIMGRVAGIEAAPRILPPSAAMATATVIGAVGRVRRRRASFCREMMRTLLHGHAYDGSRATRELGLRYTPIEETLRRTLEWYHEHGFITRPLPGVPATGSAPRP